MSYYLCKNDKAVISADYDIKLTRFVKCPNCGEYTISEQVMIDIANGIYKTETFPMVAGKVFDSFYYKQEVKTVLTDDFKTAHPITTLEKLYKLAKFAYMESHNAAQKTLPHRPACCSARNAEYSELLRELKQLGILVFNEIIQTGSHGTPTSIVLDIKLTTRAKIVFEKGINTVDDFEREFMSKTNGNGFTVIGNYNQVIRATGQANVTATQNNSPDMAELQSLIGRLLQATPKDTPQEQTQQIKECVEFVVSEMQNQTPRKSMIRTILDGLNGIVRTAEFAAALVGLVNFFS